MTWEAREALVLAHMASENRQAFEVAGYDEATRTAFPGRLGLVPSLPLPA